MLYNISNSPFIVIQNNEIMIQRVCSFINLLLLQQKIRQMEKGGRRTFLQLGVAGIISLLVLSWNKLTLNHLELTKTKLLVVPFNKNKPVSFVENFIIVNKNETTAVLSAHCTHLGCVINQLENERLICPCHGSEYDLNGKVLKGPAYKNLEVVSSVVTPDGEYIEIRS